MKLERVIEVFRKQDGRHLGTYVLNIDAEGILRVLDDLILREDDSPDQIYLPYYLTESQFKRLKPFLNEPLHADFEANLYSLECYEDNT